MKFTPSRPQSATKFQTSSTHRIRDVAVIERDFKFLENNRKEYEDKQSAANVQSSLFAKKRKAVDDLNRDDGDEIRDREKILLIAAEHASKISLKSITNSVSTFGNNNNNRRKSGGLSDDNNNENLVFFPHQIHHMLASESSRNQFCAMIDDDDDDVDAGSEHDGRNNKKSHKRMSSGAVLGANGLPRTTSYLLKKNATHTPILQNNNTLSSSSPPSKSNNNHSASRGIHLTSTGAPVFAPEKTRRKNSVFTGSHMEALAFQKQPQRMMVAAAHQNNGRNNNINLSASRSFTNFDDNINNNNSMSLLNNNASFNNPLFSHQGQQQQQQQQQRRQSTASSSVDQKMNASTNKAATMIQGNPYETNEVVMIRHRMPNIERDELIPPACNVWKEIVDDVCGDENNTMSAAPLVNSSTIPEENRKTKIANNENNQNARTNRRKSSVVASPSIVFARVENQQQFESNSRETSQGHDEKNSSILTGFQSNDSDASSLAQDEDDSGQHQQNNDKTKKDPSRKLEMNISGITRKIQAKLSASSSPEKNENLVAGVSLGRMKHSSPNNNNYHDDNDSPPVSPRPLQPTQISTSRQVQDDRNGFSTFNNNNLTPTKKKTNQIEVDKPHYVTSAKITDSDCTDPSPALISRKHTAKCAERFLTCLFVANASKNNINKNNNNDANLLPRASTLAFPTQQDHGAPQSEMFGAEIANTNEKEDNSSVTQSSAFFDRFAASAFSSLQQNYSMAVGGVSDPPSTQQQQQNSNAILASHQNKNIAEITSLFKNSAEVLALAKTYNTFSPSGDNPNQNSFFDLEAFLVLDEMEEAEREHEKTLHKPSNKNEGDKLQNNNNASKKNKNPNRKFIISTLPPRRILMEKHVESLCSKQNQNSNFPDNNNNGENNTNSKSGSVPRSNSNSNSTSLNLQRLQQQQQQRERSGSVTAANNNSSNNNFSQERTSIAPPKKLKPILISSEDAGDEEVQTLDPNSLVRDRKLLKIAIPLLEETSTSNDCNDNAKQSLHPPIDDGASPLLPLSTTSITNNNNRPGSAVSFVNNTNNNNNNNNRNATTGNSPLVSFASPSSSCSSPAFARRPLSAGGNIHNNKNNNLLNKLSVTSKSTPTKLRVSKELEFATIEGTLERNRRLDEQIRLEKAFEEARRMQHSQEKEFDRRTRDLMLLASEQNENKNEIDEPSSRLYYKFYETETSPTNACRGREQPPDWLFRARYRAIRNNHISIPPTRNESSKLREKLSSLGREAEVDASSSSLLKPSDFYVCVKLIRTRFENTSLAKWVFNCEVRQQEYADEKMLFGSGDNNKRYIFAGLQLDAENFLLFNRRVGANKNETRKDENMRILSPLEDLPWLVDEIKLQHEMEVKHKPLSLIGNQLRIIVQVIYPIREIVVDTTVQF